MSRIEKFFKDKKKVIIPYIVAGHPNLDKTLDLMHNLVASSSNVIIELGIPFSDPMADGEIIQNAVQVALENKVTLIDVLKIVKEFRKVNTFTPVVLMSYLNPILSIGYERFAILANDSGVDGVLIVDCPFEYIKDLKFYLSKNDIDIIFLIAPTTGIDRIKNILSHASGFLYYVSLKGVTGSKDLDLNQVKYKISQFRHLSSIPIVVGFGIKEIQDAKDIVKFSDGIVIGSYIVDEISKNKGKECEVTANIIEKFSKII